MRCFHDAAPALAPIAVETVDGAGAYVHTVKVFLVDFKDALDAIDAQVHRRQNRDHDQHSDPYAKQTLGLCFLLPVVLVVLGARSVNREDPRVEDAVDHDEEDADGGGDGRAGTRLRVVALRPDVRQGAHVDSDQEDYHGVLKHRLI